MKTLLIDAFLVNIMGFQSGETDGNHEEVIQIFIKSWNRLEFRFRNTEHAFNRCFQSVVACILDEIDPKHRCHSSDCEHRGRQVIDCVFIAGSRGSRGTPCHAPLLKFLAGRSQEASDSKAQGYLCPQANS